MSIEIERRFLVKSESWRPLVIRKLRIRQGYITSQSNATVRVRMVDDDRATLTVKSRAAATCRQEFEYPIPVRDARSLLKLRCSGLVRKVRHVVACDGLNWEIDVFEGENAGLVIAEVELRSIVQNVVLPDWVGEEISGDENYSNSHLAERPFRYFDLTSHHCDLSLAGE
jgi:adenylate cyclase